MYKFIFIFLIVFGCSYQKNIEISLWEQNQRDYLRIATEYPNFKPLLELKMRKARAIWSTLTREPEEKLQVQKMKQANFTIYSLLGYLTQVQNKMEILKKSLWKLSSHSNFVSNAEVSKVLADTSQYLNSLENQLKEKNFYTEEDFKAYLKEVIKDLDFKLNQLDEVFKRTKL